MRKTATSWNPRLEGNYAIKKIRGCSSRRRTVKLKAGAGEGSRRWQALTAPTQSPATGRQPHGERGQLGHGAGSLRCPGRLPLPRSTPSWCTSGECWLHAGPTLRHVPPRSSRLPGRGRCTPTRRRSKGGYARSAPVSHDRKVRGGGTRGSPGHLSPETLLFSPRLFPSVRPPVHAPRPCSWVGSNGQKTQCPRFGLRRCCLPSPHMTDDATRHQHGLQEPSSANGRPPAAPRVRPRAPPAAQPTEDTAWPRSTPLSQHRN